jgi:hypothetical protein
LFCSPSEKTLAKRKWTPDEWAAWRAERDALIAASAEDRKRLTESVERVERRLEEERVRRERRRRVVNRLSLGLLARS